MTEEKKSSVLIVDDDKFLLDMYAMKFGQQGYVVQTSLSGTDAIAQLKQGFAPDVILFDLIMPECDGFQFLQDLNESKLAVKAVKVALTNQSTDAEKKKALELGADEFIVKATMIPSEVVNTVETMLSKRKAA
jgi:CheY-like chemotaxis protein